MNILAILLLLGCIVLTVNTSPTKRNHRLEGKAAVGDYYVIGGTEYFISTAVYVGVAAATQNCQELGMKLISMDDETKNSIVMAFIDSSSPHDNSYWSSGRNFRDLWQWAATGSRFRFYTWDANMPSSEVNNNICVGFTSKGWFDNACSFGNLYICEHLA